MKEVYKTLKDEGIDVIWYGHKGSYFSKFIGKILPASYFGLIKLTNLEAIAEVITRVANRSSAALYSFNSKYEKEFIEVVKNGSWENNEERFITKKDSSFFQVVIDMDNYETDNGMMGIVRYGDDCPAALKDISNNFGEFGYLGS